MPASKESLVNELLGRGSHELTVYAPKWKGAPEYDKAAAAAGYEVVRHPTTLLLPTPDAFSRARDLVRSRDIETVWFGAAAPLAPAPSAASPARSRRGCRPAAPAAGRGWRRGLPGC